jgi:hypothetical protein
MSFTTSSKYLFSYQNTLNESYVGLVGTATYPATTLSQLQGSAVFTSNAPFSNTVFTAGYNCNAVYFPGTAGAYFNYGTSTTAPLVNISTNNLFVEAWVYFNNFNQSNYIIQKAIPGAGGAQDWGMFTSNAYLSAFYYGGGEYVYTSNTTALSSNTWYHTAMSYNSETKTITTFLNGIASLPASNLSITPANAGTTLLLGYYNASAYANMYLADIRVISGNSFGAITTDYSSTPLSVSFTGNATPINIISKSNNYSMYFPGGTGNYLTFTDARFTNAWPTNKMTFEAWVNYPTFTNTIRGSLPGQPVSFGNMEPLTNGNSWSFGPNTLSNLTLYYIPGVQRFITSTATMTSNTWNHIAVQCDATNIYLYLNGVSVAQSNVYSGYNSGNSLFTIGQYSSTNAGTTANFLAGDTRLVFGSNLYPVGGFTVPTAPLAFIPTSGGISTALLLRTSNYSFTPASPQLTYAPPSYALNATVLTNLTGQFLTYVPGKFGAALSIQNSNLTTGNANSYIKYTLPTPISVLNGITVAFWVNFYILPSNSAYRRSMLTFFNGTGVGQGLWFSAYPISNAFWSYFELTPSGFTLAGANTALVVT